MPTVTHLDDGRLSGQSGGGGAYLRGTLGSWKFGSVAFGLLSFAACFVGRRHAISVPHGVSTPLADARTGSFMRIKFAGRDCLLIRLRGIGSGISLRQQAYLWPNRVGEYH